jgi:hypothetical protein
VEVGQGGRQKGESAEFVEEWLEGSWGKLGESCEKSSGNAEEYISE